MDTIDYIVSGLGLAAALWFMWDAWSRDNEE